MTDDVASGGLPSVESGTDLPVIGHSRQGRPIHGGRVRLADDGGPRPRAGTRLLLFGGIHGDEPASVGAIVAWLATRTVTIEARAEKGTEKAGPEDQDENDDDDAGPSEATRSGRMWVIPALNPDGLAGGRKNNDADVDLNRNLPAGNFTRAHAPGYDPGPAPLSEPETQILARFIERHRVEAAIAVHAPFACVNFDGPARDWAQAVAAACGWPARESIGYPTPGSFGSWFGVDRGAPTLTLELPRGPLADFREAALAALDAAVASAPRVRVRTGP